jgi:hypothetical protein
VIRELITRPIQAANALIELPWTINRSLRQANDLMEASRRQLEVMQRQTDEALVQAERMNEMLSKVVRLTEPIEMAAKGGEYAARAAKRVIFGDASQSDERVVEAAAQAERAVEDAEQAAVDAERAAEEAERAAIEPAADEPEPSPPGGVPVSDSRTIRVVPNRPLPGEPDGTA